ncbi:MAG: VOC family protein [Acidimicrobiales bacterium]|nr:VOC family protein [Acidimicrobiales bacterium]
MSNDILSNNTGTPLTGVTGEHTAAGRPHGFSSVTPFLVIESAVKAIEFHRDVLGAKIGSVTEMPGPDGIPMVVHAEVCFTDGRIQVGEPNPAYGLIPPAGDGHAASYSMGLYVEDVDATVARAVTAGAVVREPAQTFVSGDRFASIVDPFGVRWSLMTRVEDLSEEESAARVAAWAAEQQNS